MRMLTTILCLVATAAGAQTDSTRVTLDSLVHSLPEVMVKGRKPVMKAERGKITYDMPLLMEQMPADDAYEALSRIPGVSDADGSLKFAGNEVTLVINGKVTTLTQEQVVERLKAMPASQLARAEVMASAPARLHVRGTAINIVTKDLAGTSQLTGQIVGTYRQDKYGTGTGKGNLVWQRGKLGVDAMYAYSNGDTYGMSRHDANHPLQDGRVAYSDKIWQKNHRANHDYRLGLNYAFADNHRLDIAYTGSWASSGLDNHTTGASVSEQHTGSHTYLHNLDVSYTLPFGLQLSGSYTNYCTERKQTLDGTMFEDEVYYTTVSEQKIDKWLFTVDQTHALGRGWELSYGMKAQFANNSSYQTTKDKTEEVEDGTSSADIDERIWNVYAGFSWQFTKSLSVEASVEAEQYHSPIWSKWRVYPTVNAVWNVDADNMLNLSFHSSSRFPSYWSTMSSVYYSSIYTEIWGNPDLMPSSNYSVDLMWQLRHRYTFMAFASLTPDYFVQLPYQTSERMAVIMKETNFDYSDRLGLSASAMFSAGRWLNGNVSATALYSHDKSDRFFDLPFDRKKVAAILSGTVSARLPGKQNLRLMLIPFFQSKAIQGVYDIEPIFRMNAVLRWTSANGKWSVSANGSNIFNGKMETRSVQGNQDFRMQLCPNWVSGTLSVIYRIGNYKERKAKAVDTSRMGY